MEGRSHSNGTTLAMVFHYSKPKLQPEIDSAHHQRAVDTPSARPTWENYRDICVIPTPFTQTPVIPPDLQLPRFVSPVIPRCGDPSENLLAKGGIRFSIVGKNRAIRNTCYMIFPNIHTLYDWLIGRSLP